jgi:hypothetical protein
MLCHRIWFSGMDLIVLRIRTGDAPVIASTAEWQHDTICQFAICLSGGMLTCTYFELVAD